jgi:long-chain acyl-CoA synthetase
MLWPEPDLPRTSTGKVRRKAVAEWLARIQAAAMQSGTPNPAGSAAFGASADWLLLLIAQISGETPTGVGDELRLTEDLHLDSLGRVQLAAAIEERIGTAPEAGNGTLDQVHTLGDLRHLIGTTSTAADSPPDSCGPTVRISPDARMGDEEPQSPPEDSHPEPAPSKYIYPHWPWWPPFRWLRMAFLESVIRPLVWLLAKPSVVEAAGQVPTGEPMLIVANHVTAFDGPLLEYGLPAPIRRRMAVAMSGEMLEDFRHFRDPQPLQHGGRFFLPGPLYYFLVTALFNVFPLPRRHDFQRSFSHMGEALDRGFNVLVFPEGARSADGHLARFRPGIGLLVKQSGTSVLPMAMRGVGELKTRGRGWFRSGAIEVRIGHSIRFSPLESEAAITARLQAEVEELIENMGIGNKK